VLALSHGGHRAGLGRGAAFRLLPVTDTEADELIDSAEGVATELDGFRGSPLLDRAALRELILRFTLLLTEVPEVVEADLNPVPCVTNGCVVLDTRLRTNAGAQLSALRPGNQPGGPATNQTDCPGHRNNAAADPHGPTKWSKSPRCTRTARQRESSRQDRIRLRYPAAIAIIHPPIRKALSPTLGTVAWFAGCCSRP